MASEKKKTKKAFVPHPPVHTESDALEAAEPRPTYGTPTEKKNYAERLSRALAIMIANALRPIFKVVTPDAEGRGQEARARARRSYKKLDVGYSTIELGLALGVSIKTLNFTDAGSGRFTKNYSRVDNELRAEATDYHERQPYAVLVGVLYLPIESCDDAGEGAKAEAGISSFGAAVRYFRDRGGRRGPQDNPDRFERFFVAVYTHEGDDRGRTTYFDVMTAPPKARRLNEGEGLSFEEFIAEIKSSYDAVNNPPFEWVD